MIIAKRLNASQSRFDPTFDTKKAGSIKWAPPFEK